VSNTTYIYRMYYSEYTHATTINSTVCIIFKLTSYNWCGLEIWHIHVYLNCYYIYMFIAVNLYLFFKHSRRIKIFKIGISTKQNCSCKFYFLSSYVCSSMFAAWLAETCSYLHLWRVCFVFDGLQRGSYLIFCYRTNSTTVHCFTLQLYIILVQPDDGLIYKIQNM
jgi:hypothetical protein